MTGISATHPTRTDREQATRLVIPTAVASTLVATTLSFVGSHNMTEWLVELGLQVVAAAVVFGLVVPRGLRRESAGGRALVMAVLALLLVVPAFWIGWPVQLGAAAVLLGYAGKGASKGTVTSMTALVLGALSVIAYLSIYLGDYLDTH
jgi:hypothetical protein